MAAFASEFVHGGDRLGALEEAIPPRVLAVVNVWREARGSNLGFKDFEQHEGEREMNSLRERERTVSGA